jgi:adenosylcobalamin-dependent ribonucleoside-triphosphate reductase
MKDLPNYKDKLAEGSNPCGEQTLESYEMCNLVELFPTKAESKEDFLRTIKFAYLYGKSITLGKSHWSDTNRVQLRNRRIGVSVSGIVQYISSHGLNSLVEMLDEGYNVIQRYDEIYSDWLAIPRSIKTTSVKPSGTISLLAGVTPGIHFPESNYYIRRIRISKNSDLLPSIKKSGYKIEDSIDDPETTVVVEIPVAVGECRTINDVSIWEQLLVASLLQFYWADNQVSCTITFKPWEKDQIKHALDFFQYKLKAVSFLPKAEKSTYAQMPYEEVSKEEYEQMSKNISTLKLKDISEDSKPEIFCDNESCTFV